MNSLVGWSRTLKATILLCSGKNILARTNTQMTSTTDNDAKTAAAKTAAATLTEHCVRSGKFHQLEDIQHFLIDEMDAKKCMARGGTARAGIRTAECAEAESFYKRILIMGHELLGFTAFPLEFKSKLDDLVHIQVCQERIGIGIDGLTLADIYYGHESLPDCPQKWHSFAPSSLTAMTTNGNSQWHRQRTVR
jgi:hypothetical protein